MYKELWRGVVAWIQTEEKSIMVAERSYDPKSPLRFDKVSLFGQGATFIKARTGNDNVE